jgi:ferredoxin
MSTPSGASGGGRRAARLRIDWTACDGRGMCIELLPELLEADPWGYPRARAGAGDPVVPRELVEHARRAVDVCPLLALRLEGRPTVTAQAEHTGTTERARTL